MRISDLIKSKATETGFSACSIVSVHPLESEQNALESWLKQGMNGSMDYLEKNLEKRLNPANLEEGAKSVIIVLLNYYSPLKQSDPEAPIISKYAYGKDYHVVVKNKLNILLKFIDQEIAPCRGRAFVDSAPVLEKAWAREAGLGWIGKNSVLISPQLGSFVFIGELIIDLELEYDNETISDLCGTCTKCIDACPTGAIISPRTIDARKCISYHTLENEEEIPAEVVKKMNGRIYGCDICQDVCPWNRKLKETETEELKPLAGLLEMTKSDWINLDEKGFVSLFKESPIRRIGYKKLMANIASAYKEH